MTLRPTNAPPRFEGGIMRLLLIIIMCMGSSALGAADVNAPVVKVDDKHQMMNYPAGTKPETYRVRASSSMVLDATDYTFDVPPEIRNKPLNSIQLVQSKTNQYELTWQPGTTRYELSKATLRPLRGSRPFEAFKAGDKMIVAIGVVYETQKFAPVWTSIIEVER
jgi:hypothetical protein